MDIYEEIVARIRAHQRLVLATIIMSDGSTPLQAGAKMLVGDDGVTSIGTVGGGRVEAEVQEAARELLAADGRCLIRRYTLTEDEVGIGMLCGGNLDVLIERLTEENSGFYAKLVSRREGGSDVAVVTAIGQGAVIRGKFLISPSAERSIVDWDDMPALREVAAELSASIAKSVDDAIGKQSVTRLPVSNGELIIEPVVGLRDLLIFGGGHVSRHLSRSAVMAGFRVTVVDDRPEYANMQRFPEAHRTLAVDFDAAWDQMAVRPSTSIVIVTRGHKYDERVLERAVRTPARYIGMIGSKRKVIATFEHLVGRGISRELLRNIHAPIGLAIGASTAEEIAVSITAELIAARRGVLYSGAAMSDRIREFFQPGGSQDVKS